MGLLESYSRQKLGYIKGSWDQFKVDDTNQIQIFRDI